jgi:hypothetical protein
MGPAVGDLGPWSAADRSVSLVRLDPIEEVSVTNRAAEAGWDRADCVFSGRDAGRAAARSPVAGGLVS